MTASLPLSQLTRAELEYLRRAIQRRQVSMPLSATGLQAAGKHALIGRMGPLLGAGEEAALALIELALARGPESAPAAAVLALTLPEPSTLHPAARSTTAVLLELLGGAQRTVLIAGYEFDHGAVIFQSLHKAMVERGVKAAIHLDVAPAPSPRSKMDAYLAVQAHRFLAQNWPFGAPLPALYHWPAGCAHGSRASLHAKCVVVDGLRVLIGSANFTGRGHKRNLEVGVRIDDAALAAALEQQFAQLVAAGVLAPLPAAIAEAPPEAAKLAAEAVAAEVLVSPEARPLFDRLIAEGLPAPVVGDDVEDGAGEVIGSPELSWDAARVAVLLPEQEGSRKKLEAAGWTCFAIDLDGAGLAELAARLGRA